MAVRRAWLNLWLLLCLSVGGCVDWDSLRLRQSDVTPQADAAAEDPRDAMAAPTNDATVPAGALPIVAWRFDGSDSTRVVNDIVQRIADANLRGDSDRGLTLGNGELVIDSAGLSMNEPASQAITDIVRSTSSHGSTVEVWFRTIRRQGGDFLKIEPLGLTFNQVTEGVGITQSTTGDVAMFFVPHSDKLRQVVVVADADEGTATLYLDGQRSSLERIDSATERHPLPYTKQPTVPSFILGNGDSTWSGAFAYLGVFDAPMGASAVEARFATGPE